MSNRYPTNQLPASAGDHLPSGKHTERQAIAALTMLSNELMTLPEVLKMFQVTLDDLRNHEATWRKRTGSKHVLGLPASPPGPLSSGEGERKH